MIAAAPGDGRHYVFVSYAHDDGERVYREIEALGAASIPVYFDEGIHPGRAWQDELAAAIEGCSLFVFFLTARSAASANCQRELTFALARERPLLTVYLEDFAPPAWIELAIGDRQAIHRHRFDDGAFRERLRDAVTAYLRDVPVPDGRRAPVARHGSIARTPRRRVERVAWLVTVAVLGGSLAWSVLQRDDVPRGPAARFSVSPPDGTSVFDGYDQPLALSPDGRVLVYVGADEDGVTSLWRRPLSTPDAERLAGTEGASFPFWSPDAAWLAFFADGALKKVPAEGGAVQVIARGVATAGGGAWGGAGDILFPNLVTGVLNRVSASGGPVSALPAEGGPLWPSFVGDSDRFLYVRGDHSPGTLESSTLDGAAPVTLMEFPSNEISAAVSVPGHVLWAGDNALFVRRFDVDSLALQGEAVRLVDGVPVTGPGRAPFTVSANGVLAFWTYALGASATLEWFDRDGRSLGMAAPVARLFFGFALDPAGRRVAMAQVEDDGRATLYVRDLVRGVTARLADGGVDDFAPVWSPDGRQVAFASSRDGPPDVYVVAADARDPPVRLEQSPELSYPVSWSRDGGTLVIVQERPGTGADLAVLDLAAGGLRDLPVNTRFNERTAQLSPDGRWLLYLTDQTGRQEVWIADYPEAETRTQVSLEGAGWAEWSTDGTEVSFLALDRQFMRAAIRAGTQLEVAEPEILFDARRIEDHPWFRRYAVAPDGRLLLATRAPDPDVPPVQVVVNWPELAK